MIAFTPRRQGIAMGFLAALLGIALLIAVSVPNLMRLRVPIDTTAFAPFAMENQQLAAARNKISGTIGGVPGGGVAADRKIVKTAQLSLVAADPAKAAEAARAVAEQFGGYAVSLRVGTQESGRAQLTIRVPAAQFEEARAALHKLGSRTEDEQIQAEDVTHQYVDTEATLKRTAPNRSSTCRSCAAPAR